MKKLLPLIMLLLPLALSAQTIYIKGLYNQDKTIKVLYSNNTYDYIMKANVGRIIYFGSNPTALNIEMLHYGGSNDATIRVNTNQLIAPANVSAPRALADTLNKWLQTSFGSLGGTVDSIYFRGDTLFYNVIGEGERSAGIADTVIAGLQTLFVAGDSIGITSGNQVRLPIANCADVQACILSATPSTPFIFPQYVEYQGDNVTNIQNYNLQFLGSVDDGDTLSRDFDPFGNDIGGIKGSNILGSDNQFNSIRGVGNTLGDNNFLNTIVGQSNTLGNNNAGAFIGAGGTVVGDSTSYIFLIGDDHVVDNGINYSAAWGVGHNIEHEQSYYFGRFSVPLDTASEGGIVLGNGTSDSTRSNAFEALLDGSVTHTGAYANKPYHYTGGGSDTIPDNVSIYIYDPLTVQLAATISLPLNPIDGQVLYIIGGGTITVGNVITGFTLSGTGRTVIGDGASQLKIGKAYELHYVAANNIWYAIAF